MKYKVLADQRVQLIGGPYDGIIYKYGRVELEELGDSLCIRFEYDLNSEYQVNDPNDFRNYIGPILTELIQLGLLTGGIVFSGGSDEH